MKYKLGQLIKQRREKNQNYDVPIRGVSREGFIKPKQAIADKSIYNVFYKDDFVFNPARMEVNSIALNSDLEIGICSSLYEIFYIIDKKIILPKYLNLFIKRKEFARECEYIGIGSAREYCRVGDISNITIEVPPIEQQEKAIAVWQSLKDMSKENEAIASPLEQLCRSYMQKLKHTIPMIELGAFIEPTDERNISNLYGESELRGVTSQGVFDYSKAKTMGLVFSNYKVVNSGDFAYNPSRINLGSIALCKSTCIVSPMYIVFRIKEEKRKELLPEFLNLWFIRSEFQRSTLFYASGSVRDTFNYESMCRVKIPLPSIEQQQAIVALYKCANKSKEIATKAKQLSIEVCPALMQKAIRG